MRSFAAGAGQTKKAFLKNSYYVLYPCLPEDQYQHYHHVVIACVLCSFLMVFLCLLLSVFSTIQQYEEVAGIILYYFVSKYLLMHH